MTKSEIRLRLELIKQGVIENNDCYSANLSKDKPIDDSKGIKQKKLANIYYDKETKRRITNEFHPHI